jgi:hypothetical protein
LIWKKRRLKISIKEDVEQASMLRCGQGMCLMNGGFLMVLTLKS